MLYARMGATDDVGVHERDTLPVSRARLGLTRTRTRSREPVSFPEQDPKNIGRYVIERRLGVGGMGVVYRAFDRKVKRPVALKLVLAGDADVDRARLRREAQALASLNHPNVVKVFEVGEHRASGDTPRAYVVMELVDGHPLDRWLRLRRREPAEILPVFLQAGEGLAAAHAQGLIHRDFKPGNVLVGKDGRVRVVDFGLVREIGADEPGPLAPEARSADALAQAAAGESLTKTGTIAGTPAYMSPEQLSYAPLGPATDQFAFCVALYEALFGQHPFVVDGGWSALPYNVLEGKLVPPPADRRVPGRVTLALARGLAVEPESRWPSMAALLSELQRSSERRGVRTSLIALAVVVAVAGPWVLASPSGTDAGAATTCDEAASIMRKAWGPDARRHLSETWRGTGQRDHADTWSRVDARMQTFAEDWWEVHAAACSGDPRSVTTATCLARMARGAGDRLGLLADPDQVGRALEVIGELPSVDRCRAALEAPPAAAPEPRPRWADRLDRVDALRQAGRIEEASAELEDLLAQAEREGLPALAAEAILRVGLVEQRIGDLERAEERLEQAYLEAKRLGRDRLAAESALAMLELLGPQFGREDDASLWVRHARAEIEGLDDPHLQSRFYDGLGRSIRTLGKYEEALAWHEKALALEHRQPEPDQRRVANAMFQIGSCLGAMGQVERGRPFLEDALELQQEVLGPRHPQVANSLLNIGALLLRGDDLRALDAFERALTILQASTPANPNASWAALLNISSIHRRRGDTEAAVEVVRDYLAFAEDSGGLVDPSRLAWARGEVAMLEGRYEEAIVQYERSVLGDGVQQYEKTRGLINVGVALQRLGRLEQARAAFRRAQAAIEPEPGAMFDSFALNDWGFIVQSLADTLAAQGDHEAALRELSGAREVFGDYDDPASMASLELRLGQQLDALGRQDEAMASLVEAVRVLGSHPSAEPVEVVEAFVALGDLQLRKEQRATARENAEQAVSRAEALPPAKASTWAPHAWFLLARSLGDAPPERTRALALARKAHDAWVEQGEAVQGPRAEVERWLDDHAAR